MASETAWSVQETAGKGRCTMDVYLIAPDGSRSEGESAKPAQKGIFPPLGLMLIAALTPPSINVSITDEALEPVDFDRDVDLVGLTAMTSAAPRAYEIADRFRERGITVVMGGMHASALPHEALQHVDAVVIGEAEGVWQRLLDDFQRGELQKIYRNDHFVDLAGLPEPRRDLLDLRRYLAGDSLQATRGCPYNCSFCTVSTFFGRTYRCRPVDEVMAEVSHLRGKPALIFVDDNIMGNPVYAEELFAQLKEFKRGFFAQASASMLKTPELIRKAASAGCKALFVGLETLSVSNLAAIGKKVNVVTKYKELIKRLHDNGIAIVGAFMFGLDDDDESVFERAAQFVDDTQIDVPQFSILTPLPGTRFYEQVEQEGRIIERDWRKYNGNHVCFRPRKLSIEKLEAGLEWIYKHCYSWRSIIKRTALRLKPLIWTVNGIYRQRVQRWVANKAATSV